MKLLILTTFLFAVVVVSGLESMKLEDLNPKIASITQKSVRIDLSQDCAIAINTDQLRCLADACDKFDCSSDSPANVCGVLWLVMDCMIKLVDSKCSADDKQSIRDQYNEMQNELEASDCKDYPRNPGNSSLKIWPNFIITMSSLILAFVLKM